MNVPPTRATCLLILATALVAAAPTAARPGPERSPAASNRAALRRRRARRPRTVPSWRRWPARVARPRPWLEARRIVLEPASVTAGSPRGLRRRRDGRLPRGRPAPGQRPAQPPREGCGRRRIVRRPGRRPAGAAASARVSRRHPAAWSSRPGASASPASFLADDPDWTFSPSSPRRANNMAGSGLRAPPTASSRTRGPTASSGSTPATRRRATGPARSPARTATRSSSTGRGTS